MQLRVHNGCTVHQSIMSDHEAFFCRMYFYASYPCVLSVCTHGVYGATRDDARALHRVLCTERHLHRGALTDRGVYTRKVLRIEVFKQSAAIFGN
jgi:hypothetical protein